MWEAYDLGNEDFLWAGIPFLGGIGGCQKAPCGVVSAAAVSLGLRHRCPPGDKAQARQARHAVRTFAAAIVKDFERQFGDITCRGLVGMDFSRPGEYQKFLASGVWKDKCERYVAFMIEKLYALETEKQLFVQRP
jgi:hypothetical protein